MAKNSEWGAVAYLSQSKYGKYGNGNYTGLNKEIMFNNCTNYITGIAANSYDEAYNTDVCTTNYYYTTKGQSASTTWGATSSEDYAGFSEKPDIKYYDSYSVSSIYFGCNGERCYGHGYHETAKWYGDAYSFINEENPWLARGGNIAQPGTAGIFYLARNLGNASKRTSFRVILSPID